MSALKQAMDALMEAGPDVAKVEALTAATLHRRESPYEGRDIWKTALSRVPGVSRFECRLCGEMFDFYPPQGSESELAMGVHLAWHNKLERRLRKLEEAS